MVQLLVKHTLTVWLVNVWCKKFWSNSSCGRNRDHGCEYMTGGIVVVLGKPEEILLLV
jgi:hypothetical protein